MHHHSQHAVRLRLARTRAVGALLAAGALATLPGAARAADPVALASISRACPSQTYAFAPTAADHPSTVISGSFSAAGWWESRDLFLQGPDTVWMDNQGLRAGIPATGFVSCSSLAPMSYTITVYDTPTAPTSYSGASTAGAFASGNFRSELPFVAPGAAPYVADVTLAAGALNIAGATVASSQTVQLGALEAGPQSVAVGAAAGPQALWRVAIRPLPIEVTAVKLTAPVTRPKINNTLRYTVSGDTSVTAQVIHAGTVVRTLANALKVGRGDHTLIFDATDAASRALPDGTYMVRVSSTDPIGNVRVSEVPLRIDATKPKVTLPRSLRIGPTQAIIVKVSDRGSGLRSGVLKFRGRTVARRAAGSSQIVYRPRRGTHWPAGALRYTVQATDRAANTTTRRVTFHVRS